MAKDGDIMSMLKRLEDELQKGMKLLAGPARESKPASEVTRPERTEVIVQVIFIKIEGINTQQERFAADVLVQSRWREPRLDGEKDRELPDWGKYWDPQLCIDNKIGAVKEEVWYLLKHYDGKAYICQKRRASGTFYEKLELMDYPFDSQDLTITMTTTRGETEVVMVTDPMDLPSVDVTRFVQEQEWSLHMLIKSWTKVTTQVYASTKHKHPAVSHSCKVTRKFHYFMYNIVLIMIFISLLAFSTFVVDPKLSQNRLQLSFILLLSNITFKFTVSNTIPKVSYMTSMDKYILTSMFVLCLVCAWHAVVGFLSDTEDADKLETAELADMIAICVLGGLYVLFNVFFFATQAIKMRRKMRKYERRAQEQIRQILEPEIHQAPAQRPNTVKHFRSMPNGVTQVTVISQ